MRLPRPLVVGVLSGLAGTTAMSLSLAFEVRARHNVPYDVDYDASDHVVVAAAKVLRIMPRTPAQRRAVFLLVHWGYGSLVGVADVALAEWLGDGPASTAAFFAGCQAMACALFPLLGETPPPWQWRPDVLASSLGQHALYAGTVAAARRRLQSLPTVTA